jgi:hypothetical protein
MKTNRIFLLLFLVILAVTVYKRFPRLELKGDYVIGGFGIKSDQPLDGLGLCGDLAFRFQDNDSVYIDPQLGMAFFGDSVFRYKVTSNKVLFIKGDSTISMPCMDEGVIRLIVNHETISRLDLIRPKIKSKNKTEG